MKGANIMFKRIFILSLSFTLIFIIGSIFSASIALENKATQSKPTVESVKSRQNDVRLEISRKAKTLKLYINNELEKIYPIAIGKPSTPTPVGTYKVIEKAIKPDWWSPEGKIIKGGNPHNPIAERWMRLGKVESDSKIKRTGIGIHGTIVPLSIGTAASHGCIRMYKKDVIELYPKVPIGTIIIIK